MACAFTPLADRQLEVHHLDPLSDRGPRYTKVTDVAVLCRNCHALAHTERPPIPLSRLTALLHAGEQATASRADGD